VGTALAVDLSAEEGACAGAALEVAVDARGALCGATMRARGAPLHPAALQVSPAGSAAFLEVQAGWLCHLLRVR
jgi:hypothetical protein